MQQIEDTKTLDLIDAENIRERSGLQTPAEAAESKEIEGNALRVIPTDRVKLIPLDLIDAESQQRQTSGLDAEDLDSLAASIKAHGVKQPIIVRPNAEGRFTIVAGHRRTLASQIAGMHDIPAMIEDLDADAAFEVQLIENIQRENLNIDETAAALATLFDKHKNLAELRKITGKSKAWLSKHMAPAMPNFGKLARKLLVEDRTADIELLIIISSIEKHDPTPAELKEIEDGITARTFGRKEARRMLANLKREGEDDNAEKTSEDGEGETPSKVKTTCYVVCYLPEGQTTPALSVWPTRKDAETATEHLTVSYTITAADVELPA